MSGGDIIFSVPVPVETSDAARAKPADDGSIRIGSATHREMLRLCSNGDIFVRGVLTDNDRAVVDGVREFLRLSAVDRSKSPVSMTEEQTRDVVRSALWGIDETRPRRCADVAVDALVKARLF